MYKNELYIIDNLIPQKSGTRKKKKKELHCQNESRKHHMWQSQQSYFRENIALPRLPQIEI
jgi:hypothetical protein